MSCGEFNVHENSGRTVGLLYEALSCLKYARRWLGPPYDFRVNVIRGNLACLLEDVVKDTVADVSVDLETLHSKESNQ